MNIGRINDSKSLSSYIETSAKPNLLKMAVIDYQQVAWGCVKIDIPSLWSQVDSNSVIFKTIGISALFDLLKAVLEKDRNISNFDQYINKINNIDYLNNYFSLSGAGKTRLKRVLKFRVGLITEAGLKEEDKAFV